jgi:hypothetical protein
MATDRHVYVDPKKVRAEVEGKGTSVVCATCTHYWKARDRGIPGTSCLGVPGCGSPMAGDVFHDYDGPLPETHLESHCFICNHPSDYALLVVGKKRMIGVCETHLDLVVSREPLGPLELIAELPDKVLIKHENFLISLGDMRRKPRKKTFRDVFLEIEKELSGGEGV